MDAEKAAPYKPADLGEHATRFWDDVVRTYTLRFDELVTLAHACREIDLIEEIMVSQANRPTIARGYNGQDVADPMITELRMHRVTLNGLLKSLKLPDMEGGEAGGRKSPETREDISEKARKAVNARWAKVRESG